MGKSILVAVDHVSKWVEAIPTRTNTHWEVLRFVTRTFQVNEKVWLYNSRLKLFPSKLLSQWDGPYVIVELFENGSVLISDTKSSKQFKVNGHL